MKKILFLMSILMLFGCFSISAQTVSLNQTVSNSTGAINNTSIDTMNLQFANSWQRFSVQPIITKTSGTMAGMARLYLSNDGVNYVKTDSLTLSDQTVNTTLWTSNTPVRYVMVTVGGATTVVGTCAAKLTVGP